MKKISQLLALALISGVFLFTSCSKDPEKVLPGKDGKWTGTYTETASVLGLGGTTYNGTFNATFLKGGTGTWTDSSSTTNFNWTYAESSKVLTIGQPGQDAVNFTVSEATRKTETWKANYTITDTTGNGFNFTVALTANVKRAD